ncbi:DUF3471 domain-containing protein [Spirosoma sp. BT702]|uniref:DUF3471 domain-containing protein n=1 Tax=Spirosoma profusum TaxID=2771354 RepID=A0A927ARK6_9BACT|nr:DUF3471 domain-containing protein [Spirosoma profusum]MBD2702401.1 DUF3471 domain-containing protein [Spirosoma profusum]
MKRIFFFGLIISLFTLATSANAQTASADSLMAYSGSYTFASGSPIQKFTVTSDKGELFGEADSYGKNKLLKQPKADTYKSTSSYGSVITFTRDAATKSVTGFTMAIEGNELSAKKDKP